jgi:CMP-N,N'-diacetyllegionaminic acid synthase
VSRPSTLGLVPARGGSKSIPGKNVKPLAGHPLIEHVIRAMASSGVVDRIVVSTDDERIAAVARAAGADAPFLRPRRLAGDDAPTAAAVEHALAWLDENEGARPDYILLVQPTEPFVRAAQIRDALALMLERGADSAITVAEVPRNHHPYHVRILNQDGTLEFADPEAHFAHPRRQDDPQRWAFANLYWFKRESFLETGRIETGRRVGLPVDPISALDLNDAADWQVAEALAPGRLEP